MVLRFLLTVLTIYILEEQNRKAQHTQTKQYEHRLRMSIAKWVCKKWRMSAVGVKLYSV